MLIKDYFPCRLSRMIKRLKYVRCLGIFRSWLIYILTLLLISTIVLLYTSFNVFTRKVETTKTVSLTPLPKLRLVGDYSNENSRNDLENHQEKCDPVHIAMVCSGYNSTYSLINVVKSILFYRSQPLHFHLIIDDIAKRTLKVLFETWSLPQVNVSFYSDNIWIPKVSWIPNKHYSGVYSLLKLMLSEILVDLNKVLLLDTDVTVLSDISNLWSHFEKFDNEQMLGLVENQSNWYKKNKSVGVQPWPAVGTGYNTGVMLMDLKRLRAKCFFDLWVKTCQRILLEYFEVTLADQDIINAVIKENPMMVFTLDCTWNFQLSDHTLSDHCYKNARRMEILHWNSPRKLGVHNKHADDFTRIYKLFLEMDGNLLRRTIFGCESIESVPYISKTNICEKFSKNSIIIYRTYLFLREYEYYSILHIDVGLATQCSGDRIQLLEELANRWLGTISVAVYLSDAELPNFINFIQNSNVLKQRRNIAYHIVYKNGEFYPINYLRNIAISQISTPYVFQLDIDFLPPVNLYEKIVSYIAKFNMTLSDKKAFIIPAFETQRYRFKFPTNKDVLLKYLNSGVIYTFRYHVWTKGHASTNYSFWKTANEPYEVSWEPDFEPYVVLSKNSPMYDERFVGFGWNKVSYTTHLAALGYKFIVLPDAFIIHRPHAPSLDIGKFRKDANYRRCLKKLKDKFIGELISKYGINALLRLKRITEE